MLEADNEEGTPLNITEVRVKLMRNRSDRLRAFCSITIDDDFVVHDLRVIEGRKGFFVAMPSRKLTDNCPRCGGKNELRSKFCSECGARLEEERQKAVKRDKVHVDVAHPINTAFREMLQEKVLLAYEEEAATAAAESEGEAEEEEYFPPEEYDGQEVEDFEDEDLAEVEERVEEAEARSGAEDEDLSTFQYEAPLMDILEKDEGLDEGLEAFLSDEEPLIEEIEAAEEMEEAGFAPEPEGEPPASEEQEPEEEEPEEQTQQEEPGPSPVRRRSPRQEDTGGFGEGIL